MGEENKQKIWITTADSQIHWFSNLEKRATLAYTTTPDGVTHIKLENITFVAPIDEEISGEFDYMSIPVEVYRSAILGLPARPLKKKKLNRKSFIKALMANGVERNVAVAAAEIFKICKGRLSYPAKGDKLWQWLWR